MMKFRSLKILTDENISPRAVSFLRKKGIDVIDTKEESLLFFLQSQSQIAIRFILTGEQVSMFPFKFEDIRKLA